MLEYQLIEKETLEVYLIKNYKKIGPYEFVGDIQLHKVKGWQFLDYDSKTLISVSDLEELKREIMLFYSF